VPLTASRQGRCQHGASQIRPRKLEQTGCPTLHQAAPSPHGKKPENHHIARLSRSIRQFQISLEAETTRPKPSASQHRPRKKTRSDSSASSATRVLQASHRRQQRGEANVRKTAAAFAGRCAGGRNLSGWRWCVGQRTAVAGHSSRGGITGGNAAGPGSRHGRGHWAAGPAPPKRRGRKHQVIGPGPTTGRHRPATCAAQAAPGAPKAGCGSAPIRIHRFR